MGEKAMSRWRIEHNSEKNVSTATEAQQCGSTFAKEKIAPVGGQILPSSPGHRGSL